jgi:hypothetical protein
MIKLRRVWSASKGTIKRNQYYWNQILPSKCDAQGTVSKEWADELLIEWRKNSGKFWDYGYYEEEFDPEYIVENTLFGEKDNV